MKIEKETHATQVLRGAKRIQVLPWKSAFSHQTSLHVLSEMHRYYSHIANFS
jgi:hypothetical protein